MKVIINTINIYHIHDNKYHIDNRHNGNNAKPPSIKTGNGDNADFVSNVVVNNDEQHDPLILQLKARILQSENEIKELLDKLNNERE